MQTTFKTNYINFSIHKQKFSSVLYLLLLICLLLNSCANYKNDKPNIIVILLDDAGYNDFGFMGCEDLKTPNIDKLASKGTIFTDAHVTASVCGPSRAGLLTGRYQQRFGFECNPQGHNYGLDTSETMLPKALKSAGYSTAAIGKWHLGHKDQYHPNSRGFDYFYGFLAGGRSYFPKESYWKPGNPRAILENNKQVKFDGYLTDVLGDKTIDFIDENKQNPFFIYLAYNAVHTPMEATKADLELFKDHPRKKLAAMTWAVDRSIGNVINKLKEDGLYDNTLIFFLSDNGGANNNQSSNVPLKGYKGNQFEGGHRVPFFLTWGDRFISKQNFLGIASALDIYATSIDAAGIKNYNNKLLDGVSLLPYLNNNESGNPHNTLFWRKSNMTAVRDSAYKLIHVDYLGYKLYNLEENMEESNDLQNTEVQKVYDLNTKLTNWQNGLMNPLWEEGPVWDSISTLINTDLYSNKPARLKNHKELLKARKEIKAGIKK